MLDLAVLTLEQFITLGLDTPDVKAVLSLRVTPAVTPWLLRIDDALPPGQPASVSSVNHLLEQLIGITAPSATLDPQKPSTDIVWCRLVACLIDLEPVLARAAAVAWWRRLETLGYEQDHVASPVIAAVAAYSVSAAELALGRPVQARRWAREADCLVEAEEAGVSTATWVRASMLLGRRISPLLSFSGSRPRPRPLSQ